MRNPASFRRTAAATSLALAGAFSATFIVTSAAAGWGSDHTERLRAIEDAGVNATVSFVAFVAYQLPWLIGLLGVAHLLRGRSPLLSNLGAAFTAVGAFGYAVYGGAQLVIPAMVADPANIPLYAQLRADAEPLTGQFGAAGMIGTSVGIAVLSVGLWRARTAPRWVPALLWGWLLMEFVGTSLLPALGLASAGLLAAAFLALAVTVWRSPVALWSSPVDGPAVGLDESLASSAAPSVLPMTDLPRQPSVKKPAL